MAKKISMSRIRGRIGPSLRVDFKNTLLVISVFFVAGIITGSIVGSGPAVYDAEYYIAQSTGISADISGFFKIFWETSRFHVLILLLATTYLGFLAVPFFVAFRGYLISCSLASILATGAANSFLLALLTIGVPALFYLPCFILFLTLVISMIR